MIEGGREGWGLGGKGQPIRMFLGTVLILTQSPQGLSLAFWRKYENDFTVDLENGKSKNS